MRRLTLIGFVALAACGGSANHAHELFCGTGSTFPPGSPVISTADELEAIRGSSELTGLVICDAHDIEVVDLPELVDVHTRLSVLQSPSIRRISMPALRRAGWVSFSGLEALEEIELGAFEETTSKDVVTGLSFSGLGRVERFSLPSFQRSPSGVEIFSVWGRVIELPRLAEASRVVVYDAAVETFELPELAGASSLELRKCLRLVSLAAPKVESLTSLELVQLDGIEAVAIPLVTRIGPRGAAFDWGAATPRVDLAQLEHIGGGLGSQGAAIPLPRLREVTEDVQLTTFPGAFARLPELRIVGGDLALVPGYVDAELPKLERVGGKISLAYNDIVGLRLPALTSVGSIELHDFSMLNTPPVFDLSSLAEVRGSFLLERSGVAELSVPALVRVEGDFFVRENPRLPSCVVDAVVARLGATLMRSIDTTNNGSGACEP